MQNHEQFIGHDQHAKYLLWIQARTKIQLEQAAHKVMVV